MQSENAQQSSQSQGDYLHYIDYSDSGSEYETQSVHPADDDSESDHNESYQGTAVVKSLLTLTTLLQQILDCGCCAQCKWR